VIPRFNSLEWFEWKLRNLRIPESAISLHITRLKAVRESKKRKLKEKQNQKEAVAGRHTYRNPVTNIVMTRYKRKKKKNGNGELKAR
jgi:hypothetical protein